MTGKISDLAPNLKFKNNKDDFVFGRISNCKPNQEMDISEIKKAILSPEFNNMVIKHCQELIENMKLKKRSQNETDNDNR